MDDYIKRSNAIKTVCGDCEYYSTNDCEDCRLDRLTKIPAADVRPVKEGHWVPVTNGRGGHECDQCHDYAPSYQTGEERLSDFCPNCGAKMGGTP